MIVLNRENFLKKKLSDGREVKKEIVLLTLCPNCKHYVIKFLWYAKKGTRFHDWNETKDLKGKKADEVFSRYCDFYDFYDIPDPHKGEPKIKHSKKIPWIYGKVISDTEQIPRYIDESDNAGRKIYNKILTLSNS